MTSSEPFSGLLRKIHIFVIVLGISFVLILIHSVNRNYSRHVKNSLPGMQVRPLLSGKSENQSTNLVPGAISDLPRLNSITDKSHYLKNGLITPPSVLLRPKGGIGNQLFQYACHYAIARKHNWPLYIMTDKGQKEKQRKWGAFDREFVLDQFNIPLFEWNMADEDWKIEGAEGVGDSAMLNGNYPMNKTIQQGGNAYCQSETFFARYKDELLEYFVQNINTTSISEWIQKIDESQESVAVHVRRGDFKWLNVSVSLTFHRKCMSNIVEQLKGRKVVFFLFSDDIEYVEKNLFPESKDGFPKEFNVYKVSDSQKTNSLEELFLMQRCKHQIIPDSTFSWWGAYLNRNPDKIVYAANFRISVVETLLYPGDKFYVWFYKHLYYPADWITSDPEYDESS